MSNEVKIVLFNCVRLSKIFSDQFSTVDSKELNDLMTVFGPIGSTS